MRKRYRRRVAIEDGGSEFIKLSAAFLRALSNPVRLTVLTRIVEKEINVSNLSKNCRDQPIGPFAAFVQASIIGTGRHATRRAVGLLFMYIARRDADDPNIG